MKYLFFIALYKRLEITRRVFENIKRLQSKFDINVFGVCSNLDEAELCYEFGFDYMITDNFPLGKKFNDGLKEAMKLDFTHLMQLGSDDIITEDLLNYYSHVKSGYFGVRTSYMVEGNKAKKWTLYEDENIISPIGAGRVFKKEVLEDVLSKGDLWPDKAQRGLDGQSDTKMLLSGYRCNVLPFNGVGTIGLKSEENIWKFDDVKAKEVDFEEVEMYL